MAASTLLHTVGSQDRGSSCSQPWGSFCRLPPSSSPLCLSLSLPPLSFCVYMCMCVHTCEYIRMYASVYICMCLCFFVCSYRPLLSELGRKRGSKREPCWPVGQRDEKPAGGRTKSEVLLCQQPPPHSQAGRVNLGSREEGFCSLPL